MLGISEEVTIGKAEELKTMSEEQRSMTYSNFIQQYATSIRTSLKSMNTGTYNPLLGQQMTQSISSNVNVPTQSQIEGYLKNPTQYAKELRGISNYYETTIMQYKRTTDHFKKLLTFRYDMRLTTDFEESEVEAVLKSNNKCNDFLRDFNIPYHTKMVIDKSVTNGGGFFYLQKNGDFSTLVELPIDYCYITGRWDRGYTFALDLTWFESFAGMKDQMPEIYEYYKIFMEAKKLGGREYVKYQYYPVPVETGFVFTFGVNETILIPPFSGVFRDATAIFTYKNLLMQKTALDTWKVIAQKIPLDKNDVPIFNGTQAQMFVDFAQQVLPNGTAVFATPMDIKELDLSGGTATQDNITGRGEELFWRSVGVNGSLMDSSDKSSATMRFSLLNDEGFVDNIYQQFADFINLQLRIISRKYRFTVKFYGNRYLEEEDIKTYKDVCITTNGLIGKLYALMGYEPFELVPTIKLENALGYKDIMKPIIAGSQMSGDEKNGAPMKSDTSLTTSGEKTRTNDSNARR